MDLLDRLGLEIPVVQAGMGGGVASADLAAAVSNAGALGTVGMLDPARFGSELRRARRMASGRPVAANLLVPFVRRSHVRACIEAGVDCVVLHGGLHSSAVRRLRDAGVLVLHQVGDAVQAGRAIGDGAHGVIAQGREAGGHLLGGRSTLVALREISAVVGDRPVLAAGGVAGAEDVRTFLRAGADAVVAGTAFLLTGESRAHPMYKARVLAGRPTIATLLFGFGWPLLHRVVPNAATDRWASDGDIPAALRAAYRATTVLGRALPMRLGSAMARAQRPGVPLFSPAVAVEGMRDEAVDATPLYASDAATRIDQVRPAADVVRSLTP